MWSSRIIAEFPIHGRMGFSSRVIVQEHCYEAEGPRTFSVTRLDNSGKSDQPETGIRNGRQAIDAGARMAGWYA